MDPFLAVSDLSDYLGQDLSADDAAAIVLAGACDMVRTYTEQLIDLVAVDAIFLDGTGTDALLLPGRPVNSVASVAEEDEVLIVDEDYKLNGNGVLLRLPTVSDEGWSNSYIRRTWRPGRQNIEVTYSHGYLSQDIPNDIKMVALTIAARLLAQASQGNAVEQSEALGAYSISTRYSNQATAADLTKGEIAILRKYRVSKGA